MGAIIFVLGPLKCRRLVFVRACLGACICLLPRSVDSFCRDHITPTTMGRAAVIVGLFAVAVGVLATHWISIGRIGRWVTRASAALFARSCAIDTS